MKRGWGRRGSCLFVEIAPTIHISDVTSGSHGEYVPIQIFLVVCEDLSGLPNRPDLSNMFRNI